MTLDELTALLSIPSLSANGDFDSITEDSRKVRTASLFVAIDGNKSDGHDFAEEAVAKGAVAVLGNKADSESYGIFLCEYRHAGL